MVRKASPDEEGLRLAFERHARPLLPLCLLLTGGREAAEDVLMECFVRLAPKIEHLEVDEVWPYLRQIAVNLCKNRFRRLAVEARFASRHEGTPAPTKVATFEERERVWRAVRGLPKRQRACIALRYYEDLSERDTAVVLGCSVGTVKSQTAKGLAKLSEVLVDVD